MKKLTLILILLLATITISKADSWTRKADFPGIGRAKGVGFSIGNIGFVGAGLGSDMHGLVWFEDFWAWDQLVNIWRYKANLTGLSSAVIFPIGGKGYMGTGDNNYTRYSIFGEWDTAMFSLTGKANFGGGAREDACGFTIGTKGYIGTGLGNNGYNNDLWEWDLPSNTWTQKANLPGDSRICAVSFVINNKGYIGLGKNSSNQYLNDFWEWDQANNIWTQKANYIGVERYKAVGFSIGTIGYVGTGMQDTSTFYNDFWSFDPISNIWTQKANFGGEVRGGAVSFSIGSKGYIGTGYNYNNYFNDFWEYTPDSTNGIPELTQEIKTSLYPNPMQDKTILTIQGSSKNALLNIYDINGQKVRSISTDNRQEIIISRDNLASGIYFYELKNSQAILSSGKIVVE